MIVKNEQECLGRCLKSVKGLFDEIVIVDTGSSDKTIEIAKSYGANVFHFDWIDDFSAARNFSFKNSTCDYVMWLDADDVVENEDFLWLQQLKLKLDGSVDVYMLKYHIAFDIQNNPTFSYYRERILKNDGSFVWQGAVHEVITPHGKIEYCNAAIRHKKKLTSSNPKRNLKIYRKLLKIRPLISREQYYYGRELFYNGYLKKCISVLKSFVANSDGWIEDKIGALEILCNCYMKLKQYYNAKSTIFTAFELSEPRPWMCCMLGDCFFAENQLQKAISWFEFATNCHIGENGFVQHSYSFLYPTLRLCQCYYFLGDYKKSKECNDQILEIDPKNKSAIFNDQLFQSLNFK